MWSQFKYWVSEVDYLNWFGWCRELVQAKLWKKLFWTYIPIHPCAIRLMIIRVITMIMKENRGNKKTSGNYAHLRLPVRYCYDHHHDDDFSCSFSIVPLLSVACVSFVVLFLFSWCNICTCLIRGNEISDILFSYPVFGQSFTWWLFCVASGSSKVSRHNFCLCVCFSALCEFQGEVYTHIHGNVCYFRILFM